MTASDTRIDEPGAGRGESGGFELGISAELTELAKVRHWVRTVLRGFPANVVSTAVMVVDELTSNALRHGRAPYHVRLLPGAAKLRIEVDDSCRESARRRTPDDHGGRGLLLVDRCAAAWGQLRRPSGKTLWAELTTDPGPARG